MENTKTNFKILATLALFGLVTSCDIETEFEKQVKEEDERIQNFLTENNLTATKHSSNIYYDALVENPGGETPQANEIVSFYYQMSTLDSSYQDVIGDSLNPARTEHQFGKIIPTGLSQGISLMKNGEKYRFIIPSYFAYDSYGNADFFGPNSIFIIDIEIVDIQTKEDVLQEELDSIDQYIETNNIEDIESFSSGLYYKVLEEGTGDQPSSSSVVTFNYVRRYLDGTGEFESDPNNPVVIGLSAEDLLSGVKEGLLKMKEGEKAMFIMPSGIAYGSSLQVLPQEIRDELIEEQQISSPVLPFSPIIFEIELEEIE